MFYPKKMVLSWGEPVGTARRRIGKRKKGAEAGMSVSDRSKKGLSLLNGGGEGILLGGKRSRNLGGRIKPSVLPTEKKGGNGFLQSRRKGLCV